jgi:hypothetical protein
MAPGGRMRRWRAELLPFPCSSEPTGGRGGWPPSLGGGAKAGDGLLPQWPPPRNGTSPSRRRATAHLPPGGASPSRRRAERQTPSSLPSGVRARSLVGPRGALSIPRDLEEAEASGRMAGAFPSPAADVVPGKVSGKRMARGMEETGVGGLRRAAKCMLFIEALLCISIAQSCMDSDALPPFLWSEDALSSWFLLLVRCSIMVVVAGADVAAMVVWLHGCPTIVVSLLSSIFGSGVLLFAGSALRSVLWWLGWVGLPPLCSRLRLLLFLLFSL